MSWVNTPTYDPTTGETLNRWTQTQTLTPEAQRALEAQFSVQTGRSELGEDLFPRVKDEFGDAMDWSQFQQGGQGVDPEQLQRSLGGGQQYFNQAGDALQQQFDRRMNPQFEQDQASQDAQLRARGMKPGDQAYDRELEKLRQNQGDQRANMYNQATMLSGQEGSRMQNMDALSGNFANMASGQQFGQNMQADQYQTQLRQQQIAEAMQQRGFSLNEINALISGQQVAMPNMPSFNNAGRAETTQYSNAAGQQYQAAQDSANAKNAFANSAMSMFGNIIPG